MIVDVVTSAEVATDVVVVDELVVSDVRVSVDDVASVVVAVDSVEIEDASVVPIDEAVVASTTEVVGVEAAVVDSVVRVELSIGMDLIALAKVIFEIIPTTAKKKIRTNAIRNEVGFT